MLKKLSVLIFITFCSACSFFRPSVLSAAQKGEWKKVSVLAEQNNDVNISDTDGMTPLMLVVERGNWDELNKTESRPENIFQALETFSALKQSPEYAALKALLAAGADINATDIRGRTALIIAAQKENAVAVSALLKNNADPSIRDMYDYTALSYAENQEIIRLLVQAGERKN